MAVVMEDTAEQTAVAAAGSELACCSGQPQPIPLEEASGIIADIIARFRISNDTDIELKIESSSSILTTNEK